MGHQDPNEYTAPERPKDVSARPEWPNIIETNHGWSCATVTKGYGGIGGPLGFTPGSCCIYMEGGKYTTNEECVEETGCDYCREPVQVLDWANRNAFYDSDFQGYWHFEKDDGTPVNLYMFAFRYFAPVDYYYIGDHHIFGYHTGLDMDPDKRNHTYLQSAYISCDRDGTSNCAPVDYGYSARMVYAPRTLYRHTNTRFVAYDRDTLMYAGDFTKGDHAYLDRSGPGTWVEERAEYLKWYGHSRPVYDEKREVIGHREVFTEYDPWREFYGDYDKGGYSYAQWKEMRENPKFVYPPYLATEGVPNESLVHDYVHGSDALRTNIRFHMPYIEEAVEWYNFVHNQIDPPGWVEDGWPIFFKTNYFSWVGEFKAPDEKIMKNHAQFYEGVNLQNINSNLDHKRHWQEMRFRSSFPNNSWGDNHTIRPELYQDRGYNNNGHKMVLENKETGKVTFTSIPIGVQGFQSTIFKNETVEVLDPIFDDVYVGTQRELLVNEETGEEYWTYKYGDSLWSSTTGRHCFEGIHSIDGVYPLYLDPKCAYKHDPDGEYIVRKFRIKVDSELHGDHWAIWNFYQPKHLHGGSLLIHRFDGDFPGGNGEHRYPTVPFEEWVEDNPDIAPDEPDVFIPHKPTSGPSNPILEKGVVIPIPTSGPTSPSIISGVILPPTRGPYAFYLLDKFYVSPLPRIGTGPTDIALNQPVPEFGPVSAALVDRSNPPVSGPANTVLLETIAPPYYGPATIILVELPPASGPSSVTLIELAPSTGPSDADPVKTGTTIDGNTYLIPTSGPASVYIDKAPPLSGPNSVFTDLLPTTGPTDTQVAPGPATTGPTNASAFELQEAYECFDGDYWTYPLNQYSWDFTATIRGLRSGAEYTAFKAIHYAGGSKYFSIEGGYSGATGNCVSFEVGEIVHVTNSTLGVGGYYNVTSYTRTATHCNANHYVYIGCDVMPITGPSSSVLQTVSHTEVPLPTTGPASTVLNQLPSAGPSSAETAIAEPFEGPKSLSATELEVNLYNFFYQYGSGYPAYGDAPTEVAVHTFLYSIAILNQSGSTAYFEGLGPGLYNINSQGDALTFTNPYNYTHQPTITTNQSTGKELYSYYDKMGTVTVNCSSLVGSLTQGQSHGFRLTVGNPRIEFEIDSTSYDLVNCTENYWSPHGGYASSTSAQPNLHTTVVDFNIVPTTAGTCSLKLKVRKNEYLLPNLTATLVFDVT